MAQISYQVPGPLGTIHSKAPVKIWGLESPGSFLGHVEG